MHEHACMLVSLKELCIFKHAGALKHAQCTHTNLHIPVLDAVSALPWARVRM